MSHFSLPQPPETRRDIPSPASDPKRQDEAQNADAGSPQQGLPVPAPMEDDEETLAEPKEDLMKRVRAEDAVVLMRETLRRQVDEIERLADAANDVQEERPTHHPKDDPPAPEHPRGMISPETAHALIQQARALLGQHQQEVSELARLPLSRHDGTKPQESVLRLPPPLSVPTSRGKRRTRPPHDSTLPEFRQPTAPTKPPSLPRDPAQSTRLGPKETAREGVARPPSPTQSTMQTNASGMASLLALLGLFLWSWHMAPAGPAAHAATTAVHQAQRPTASVAPTSPSPAQATRTKPASGHGPADARSAPTTTPAQAEPPSLTATAGASVVPPGAAPMHPSTAAVTRARPVAWDVLWGRISVKHLSWALWRTAKRAERCLLETAPDTLNLPEGVTLSLRIERAGRVNWARPTDSAADHVSDCLVRAALETSFPRSKGGVRLNASFSFNHL